jgi:hypothetical protein
MEIFLGIDQSQDQRQSKSALEPLAYANLGCARVFYADGYRLKTGCSKN